MGGELLSRCARKNSLSIPRLGIGGQEVKIPALSHQTRQGGGNLGVLLGGKAGPAPRTDDKFKWIELTDGGHFENLGLYEMIMR